jgi:xylulokinase
LYRNVENAYYAMAAMANAGLALEWVRGILSLSWETMYQEAFSVPSGSEGVVFLPYLMGERTPHLNPNARTCWQNMSLKHTRGHLARAAFEGVAFALKDGLVALEATGIHAKTLRLSGGGSLQVQWRQLIADVLQKPLESVYVPSASAKGAALLAASSLGYNFKPDTHENAALTHAKPDEALERAYQDFSSLYYKLYPSTQ